VSSLEKKLGVSRPEDWYRVNAKQLRGLKDGRSLLRLFKLHEALKVGYPRSPLNCYELAYPDQVWVNGKFLTAPASTWKDRDQTRLYLQSIEPFLEIKEWSDWYVGRTEHR
jgi:hypothetical protein